MHITKDKHRLTELKPCHRIFETANGTTLTAQGVGSIQVYSPDPVIDHNVYYCPKSNWNLLNTKWLLQHGMQLHYQGKAPYTRAAIRVPGHHLFNVDLTGAIPRIIEDRPAAIPVTIPAAVQAVTREANKRRHWLPTEEQVDTADMANKDTEQPQPEASPGYSRSTSQTRSRSTSRSASASSRSASEHICSEPPAASPEPATTRIPRANIHEWHERLAHLSKTQIRKLQAVKLVHIKRQPGEQGACNIYSQSKATKTPSKDHFPATTRPFERFHFDLVGGKRSLLFTVGRYKYILIVTDDYSRYK